MGMAGVPEQEWALAWGTEGGVTSVVSIHSSAMDLDDAQRGCGRGRSQPDGHILWEKLALPRPVGAEDTWGRGGGALGPGLRG